MHIVYWSPVAGQTGTTASLLAAVLMAACTKQQKVLLTQTHYNNRDMEEILLGGKTEKDIYQDIGLDALFRLMRTGNLMDSHKNFVLSLLKEKLDILPGTEKEKNNVTEEEMIAYLPELYGVFENYYDFVFTDAVQGNDRVSKSLMEKADLVVVTLNQNKAVIEKCLKNYQLTLEKTVFILGSYCSTSAYNQRNLERKYKEFRGRLYTLPFCEAFQDASSNCELITFFLNNMTLKNRGKAEGFFDSVAEITDMFTRIYSVKEG